MPSTSDHRPEYVQHVASGDQLTPNQLYRLLQLRVQVFVVEQECPYPELDGRDLAPTTRHLWCTEAGDDTPLACLRLLEEDGSVRIGRVCTALSARGTGQGRRMMTAALAEVGDRDTVLDAQTQARGFYAAFGYAQCGPEYLEDGIPHVPMRRPATPTRTGVPV
ncbi:GNAT family N-acetyltransferase [Actinoalloteichus spitiensis]|uniref:GNAT family N-acetyltransferase n=1 Tax=Actinoalloteichus spitiensis TaxID=252394 RepID=UPI0003612BB7|nr:GNAT family N-acetyltransferase [Actinoalloteichus spitiensis]